MTETEDDCDQHSSHFLVDCSTFGNEPVRGMIRVALPAPLVQMRDTAAESLLAERANFATWMVHLRLTRSCCGTNTTFFTGEFCKFFRSM